MRRLREALSAGHEAADSVKSAADLIAALLRQAAENGIEFSLEVAGRQIPVKLKMEVGDE